MFLQKYSLLKWKKRHIKNYYHFMRILQQICQCLLILKEIIFFSKKPRFLQKKRLISHVVENSYNFIRILRQTCRNLVMENFKFRTVLFSHFIQNRAIGKKMFKNAKRWEKEFPCILLTWGKIMSEDFEFS